MNSNVAPLGEKCRVLTWPHPKTQCIHTGPVSLCPVNQDLGRQNNQSFFSHGFKFKLQTGSITMAFWLWRKAVWGVEGDYREQVQNWSCQDPFSERQSTELYRRAVASEKGSWHDQWGGSPNSPNLSSGASHPTRGSLSELGCFFGSWGWGSVRSRDMGHPSCWGFMSIGISSWFNMSTDSGGLSIWEEQEPSF